MRKSTLDELAACLRSAPALAQEIADDLQTALGQFQAIADGLRE